MCDTASRDWDRGTRAIVTIRTSPQDSRTTQCSDFIPVHVPMQIKLMMEHATRVAAWTAMEDRLLLVQRWQGTKIAELSLPNKTPVACAHRWKRFHTKVLHATMMNLPQHASSDFVAEQQWY